MVVTLDRCEARQAVLSAGVLNNPSLVDGVDVQHCVSDHVVMCPHLMFSLDDN